MGISTELDPYNFTVSGGFHQMAANWMYSGALLGLSREQIMKALAFESAIVSGELPLPMSQEECEENLATGSLEIDHALKLMAKYPDFVNVACAWAQLRDPAVFYFPDLV